jgi:hypothetical protein
MGSAEERSMLQYGPSAAGGWDYWAIASWYVTLTDDVIYSEIQTVQSGDVIFGTLVLCDMMYRWRLTVGYGGDRQHD